MREAYIDKNFNESSLAIIWQANQILKEYADAGYTVTLRQLYYQFVARGFLPNRQNEYKRLGSIISDARLAGRIDWEAIVDKDRVLKHFSHNDDINDIISGAGYGYSINPWANQENYIEVWIEKNALMGVIERPCREYRVPHFACRGYTSQSAQWRASKRFAKMCRGHDKNCFILHLGDHDPSGIDMTRDNDDRLYMFEPGTVEIRRLALNWDQVEEHSPPPNPTKLTDSRAPDYIANYGNDSWELDALNPDVIDKLIRGHLENLIDIEQWNKDIEEERKTRAHLIQYMSGCAEGWDLYDNDPEGATILPRLEYEYLTTDAGGVAATAVEIDKPTNWDDHEEDYDDE